MADTPKLGLPRLISSQAQKHVTMNEALQQLDVLVQLSVKDKDLSAPPAAPAEGDAYIVGASATGLWDGHSGKVAAFSPSGIWFFHVPKAGWVAYVEDESKHYSHDGSVWAEFSAGGGSSGDFLSITGGELTGNLTVKTMTPTLTVSSPDTTAGHALYRSVGRRTAGSTGVIGQHDYINNADDLTVSQWLLRANGDVDLTVGVLKVSSNEVYHAGNFATGNDNRRIGELGLGGATADTVNAFSINTIAALFNNAGADIRLNLNKNAVGDTASLVFQSGFSGRAEIGLTGNDDFSFKVSPDGSTFHDSIIIDRNSGKVSMPKNPGLDEFIFPLGGGWLLDPNENVGWGIAGGPYDDVVTNDLGNVGADYARTAGGLVFPFDVELLGFGANYYVNNALAHAWGWRIGYIERTHNSNVVTTTNLLQQVADNGGVGPNHPQSTIHQVDVLDFSSNGWIIPAGRTIILSIEAPTADATNRYVYILSGYLYFKRVNN